MSKSRWTLLLIAFALLWSRLAGPGALAHPDRGSFDAALASVEQRAWNAFAPSLSCRSPCITIAARETRDTPPVVDHDSLSP